MALPLDERLPQNPFIQGILDSFDYRAVFETANKRPKMMSAITEVVKTNGLFFLCHSLLTLIIIPIFHSWTLQPDLSGFEERLINFAILLLYLFVNVGSVIIYLVLLDPNAAALEQISSDMESKGKTSVDLSKIRNEHSRGNTAIHDAVYDGLLVLSFMVVVQLLALIPYLGKVLSFCYSAWLTSFYSWSYKWRLRYSLGGSTRNTFFEERWLYLLGFGAPLTFSLSFLPSITGLGIFAMLFPISVALAQKANPVKYTGQWVPARIQVFKEADILAGVILEIIKFLLNLLVTVAPLPPGHLLQKLIFDLLNS